VIGKVKFYENYVSLHKLILCMTEESLPQQEIMIREGEGGRKEPVIHNKLQKL